MTRRILHILILAIAATILLIATASYGAIRDDDIAQADIIISEVCASNEATAHDENGHYGADYIELYNVTDEPVNVGGYGLSDSLGDFYEYVLPDVEIDAHATLVVWSDDAHQDLSLYGDDYEVNDVHGMGFGISTDGDKMYLTDRDGGVASQIAIPEDIPEGQTYQITLADIEEYVCGEPTLYYVADNADEIEPEEYHMVLDEPAFSVDGGWYEEPISVELSSETGEIYYTLDGSEPDENAILYDGPITVTNRSDEPNIYSAIGNISINNPYLPEELVDKCTVLKAVVIDGEERSDVGVRSYFVGIGDDEEYQDVAVISLTMDPDDLFDYYDGIYTTGYVNDSHVAKYGETDLTHYTDYISGSPVYANYAMEGIGWERPAQIEFYTADREEVLRQDIGIRIHGGMSVTFNQKGFNLYAREVYDGNTEFRYDFFGRSYNKLMLRTGGYKDSYITKLRDVLAQRLVSDRSAGWQDSMPCVVFLNGEYWGLYNLQETIGEDYIEARYGVDAENVIVYKNPWDVDEPERELYTEAVRYASEHDLSVDENYAWMAERIDIQSYIDYFCTEIYIANVDAIDNNYAIWRSREVSDEPYEDGKWRFLLYDLDDSISQVNVKSAADVDSFVMGHWWNDPLGDEADILFSNLMKNASFKEQFATSFMDMANENYDYEHVHSLLYEMAEQYCAPNVASQQRFRGSYRINEYDAGPEYDGWYTEDDFWEEVQVIDDFFRERKEYITVYMGQDLELSGERKDITVSCNIDDAAAIRVNTLTIDGSSDGWQGQYYTDYKVHLECIPEEGYRFEYWIVDGDVVSDETSLDLDITEVSEIQAVVR